MAPPTFSCSCFQSWVVYSHTLASQYTALQSSQALQFSSLSYPKLQTLATQSFNKSHLYLPNSGRPQSFAQFPCAGAWRLSPNNKLGQWQRSPNLFPLSQRLLFYTVCCLISEKYFFTFFWLFLSLRVCVRGSINAVLIIPSLHEEGHWSLFDSTILFNVFFFFFNPLTLPDSGFLLCHIVSSL